MACTNHPLVTSGVAPCASCGASFCAECRLEILVDIGEFQHLASLRDQPARLAGIREK